MNQTMTQITLSPAIEKALADLRVAIENELSETRATAASVASAATPSTPPTPSPLSTPAPTISPLTTPPPTSVSEPAIPYGLPATNISSVPDTSVTPTLSDNHLDEPFDGRQVQPVESTNILGGALESASLVTPPPSAPVDMTQNLAQMEIPAPEPTAIDGVAPTMAAAPQPEETDGPGLSRANSLLASVRARGWSGRS